ncbi:arylamine N-acetyltransferase [Amycolatopsis acidiphila]|uniref:Arylamine N-acetyltransferase n=1 Tax=Amycolatopsis acidiphila TaxID=715473 RepID=A0A558AJQ9_9PSEU|nr:arylamine N-acetyltransferase [Amycolatopsis acidiphila]TVT24498.1 arylamine N-acetyltransferase [Amycolatopsis acidiphila]UIJ59291.1 arylamine N-acetyltransferase [Amycolatopsis acidiphila]GHG79537.1 N-hydroxyarylamine O-acetyltransferase [Amycolatopsis acidiphila]
MDVDAYLARIGASRPAAPTAEALAELHERHISTVPFENLSVHLPEPIVLDEDALADKIVGRRRGGFCYELNGAFAALLRELGFEVTLLSARVFGGDRFGAPFNHLALRVDLEEPWLADVGFGRFARRPLRLTGCDPQADAEGEFLLLDAPGGDIDARHGGKPAYRLEQRPRELADFVPTCWWQATSPDSHFTKNLLCTLPTPGGRVTLADDQLIETAEGKRVERVLAGAELVDAYRAYFGIELAEPPTARSFT